MLDDNGEIMVKRAKDFTKEEWFNWWDPDREDMLFSAPEAKSSVSTKQLMAWEKHPEKFTILVDGKVIANSELLRYKYYSFYDFDTKALDNGKTEVSLISKDSFLAPEYYDKYWRRNVILKDGSKESM